jgi:hypothetical protein
MMKMKKLGLSALALFVMAVSAVTLRGGSVQPGSEFTTNAAYRDGLYLGKLAAEQGSDSHIASGRWSQANDRAAFAAGYEEAYKMQLATRMVVQQ